MSSNILTEPVLVDPPGLRSFEKCQTNEEFAHLQEVAVSMLIAVANAKVCSLPKGSRASPQWQVARVVIHSL